MQSLWQITIDDYLTVVEIAQKLGIKPGESMEEVFFAYMQLKNQKPITTNELTKEELIQEIMSHNKSLLQIETDKEGKQKYIFCKQLDNEE
ncbi:MAG: hypothetical protein WC516_06260 [Patescibacteria group bacterium]|jgi:hypothetical protein